MQWYLKVFQRRNAKSGPTGRFMTMSILIMVILAGLALLRSIWSVLMNGFLTSTPLVAGSQVGTYYWNSAMFAFKSTLIIGCVMLLVVFFLGVQANRLFRR